MPTRRALAEGTVRLDLQAHDIRSAITRALDAMVQDGQLSEDARGRVEASMIARETSGSTAMGASVAVPHAHLDCLPEPAIAFVRLARPLDLGAPDGIPTRFLFLLTGPAGKALEHLETLLAIARLMSDRTFRDEAQQATDRAALLVAHDRHTARSTARSPSRPHQARAKAKAPPHPTAGPRPLSGLFREFRRWFPY